MRIMSLDVGSQTIGVAVSDLFGWTAQGVETIRHTTREKDFVRLRHLADEYNVEEFVIGMPLNMNGTKGMRAEQTEKFAEALAAAFPDIPYHFWDERLTTVMAQRQLIEADDSRVAWLSDTAGLPEKTLKFLRNNQPQVMVIDCSHPPREDAPRNHCDLNTVLALNEVIRSPRVILTHISHQFDAWLMENALPSGFEAGFDGMEIGVA